MLALFLVVVQIQMTFNLVEGLYMNVPLISTMIRKHEAGSELVKYEKVRLVVVCIR